MCQYRRKREKRSISYFYTCPKTYKIIIRNYPGGNCLGGNYPGGNYPSTIYGNLVFILHPLQKKKEKEKEKNNKNMKYSRLTCIEEFQVSGGN